MTAAKRGEERGSSHAHEEIVSLFSIGSLMLERMRMELLNLGGGITTVSRIAIETVPIYPSRYN